MVWVGEWSLQVGLKIVPIGFAFRHFWGTFMNAKGECANYALDL